MNIKYESITVKFMIKYERIKWWYYKSIQIQYDTIKHMWRFQVGI